MEYNNKAKLKEQNSIRLNRLQEGISGYQRGGVKEGGWKGTEKGIEEYHDWCTWCVWGHGEDSVAQRRQVGTLWHLTTLMDSGCSGVWGDSIISVNVVTTLFIL